jgi:hypothetical protein
VPKKAKMEKEIQNPGKGQNNFYRIELPWTVHPERDQEWYEAQRAEIYQPKVNVA